jgi:hypothetical protein
LKDTGVKTLSTHRSEPKISFTSQKQFGGAANGIKLYVGKEFERENLGLLGPGPGKYDLGSKVKPLIGAEYESQMEVPWRECKPKISFTVAGSSKKGSPSRPSTAPGPGSYNQHSSSMAEQILGKATTKSNPRCHFGTAKARVFPERTKGRHVLISHEHARKENLGVHSPPSTIYSPGHMTAHGKICAGPKATFGTNPRFRDVSLAMRP